MKKTFCMLLLVICACLFTASLSSLEYGLLAKKEGKAPVKKLAIFSERCSGSKYITRLLLANLKLKGAKFCHKHFPPWYNLPQSEYKGDPKQYTFESTEDTIFVVIFRDPYDWVRSFHRKPYHASNDFKGVSFSEFIRKPWNLDFNQELIQILAGYNPLIDRNPEDGSLFENVFKLRTAKIKDMLLIQNKAKNVYYINYEIARDRPKKVVDEISKKFSIGKKQSYFKPITQYVGGSNDRVFEKPEYPQISEENMAYINTQLDIDLEKKIGYDILDKK